MVLAERRFAILAFVFLILFWSSAFGAIKVSLEYAPPILFAGMRTLLCGAVVTLVALVWGGQANLRRDWPVYLLLAALNVVLFMGLQTLTILYMPSGSAAVVIYLQPILVGLLSYLMLGEQLSAAKIVGLALGFSGVVVVSAGSFSGSSLGTPLGVAFGLASALSWTLGTVYFKRYGERLSTLWAVAVPFSAGGVVLTGLGLVLEPLSEISWTGTYVASFLYAALVGTALAWMLWLGLVSVGEASRVSAYVFFVPLVSVLLGAVFLGEALSPWLLAGGALVVCGIYLVNKQPAK
ncbi:MAG: Permease of the drug/metabolite transporter (DMT) superfamily [uncultured Rubrobacteraceae bacterium]|uniref:Permease of the drug/metabolite transporter (DMT) superfamily n=1 Tax=uncultured Rubrobacteraceae bacterium TaxID=349277 RepID=A0A6J4PEX0_9ACTN|nr:MAG: Permease of the drug/metabolite transporter (DMT) superfamily [uncultured Rubrobacteraceae bacterium]